MAPFEHSVHAASSPLVARSTHVEHQLRSQWSNPNDILSLLLIVGGDVIQRSLAQLACRGIAPVSFSFGWVAFSFNAVLASVGDKKLMPEPDFPALVLNVKDGHQRTNGSWVIGRLTRDIDKWVDTRVKADVKKMLDQAQKEFGHNGKVLKRGLCVSIYEVDKSKEPGKPHFDLIWACSIAITIIQLAIAAIPWALYNEWEILLITFIGTFLAYTTAALPQWANEKWACRKFADGSKPKTVAICRGNGSQHALIIHSHGRGLDLEDLAGGERVPDSITTIMSFVYVVLWTALLITVSGVHSKTWYLVAIGAIGMAQNIFVAGRARSPDAFGIHLQYRGHCIRPKVMGALMETEIVCKQMFGVQFGGRSLVPVFFPGRLRNTEQQWWDADASKQEKTFRQDFWKKDEAGQKESLENYDKERL